MDRYALTQARIDRHMSAFGPDYEIVRGRNFDVRVYRNSPCGVGISLFTEGMSAYQFRGADGREPCSFELHTLVDGPQSPEPFAEVLMSVADALLERAFDLDQWITQGEILENETLKTLSKRSGYTLSSVLLGWSVWLPSDSAWGDDDTLGPLAIVDVIPITPREAADIHRDRAKFEQDTASGQINLLDFRRETDLAGVGG